MRRTRLVLFFEYLGKSNIRNNLEPKLEMEENTECVEEQPDANF